MNIDHPILGPLKLIQAGEGVYLDEDGRYHPYPGADPFFVNPPGPSFGVAKTGDLYRVILEFGAVNASLPYARNVFHYVLKGVTGSPTFAAVATELLKQLFIALGASSGDNKLTIAYPPTYEFRRPKVQSMVEATDSFDGSNTQKGVNGSSQGSLPLRSSFVFHKGTAKAGRSFSGRTFWPAPDEHATAAGVMASAPITGANNTGSEMQNLSLAAINNGASSDLTVYSAKQSKSTGSNVATPTTSYSARAVLGSQRRRQDVT